MRTTFRARWDTKVKVITGAMLAVAVILSVSSPARAPWVIAVVFPADVGKAPSGGASMVTPATAPSRAGYLTGERALGWG